MKRIFTVFMILLGICFSASAKDLNKEKLDSLFDILSSNNKAMGSISIFKAGAPIYSKAFGFAYKSEAMKTYSTTLTKYRIGSISKMFTSTLAFQLIEEGKLSLIETLDKYFPQIPNAKKITISNLLNHHSGIHNFTDDKEYQDWMESPKSRDEMIEVISKAGSDFEPNAKAEYSNSNYVLLGYIIEKITGQTYAQALKDRIVDKIGLTNTYYGAKPKIKLNEALSYTFLGEWKLATVTDMSIPHGAGAVVSNPNDLNLFINALFNYKLINKASLDQMTTINDGYGYGIFKFPFGPKTAYGHTGGIDGFVSNLAYIPEDKYAVALCSNGINTNMNDIMIGVLSILYDMGYKLPVYSIFTPDENDLDHYIGEYSSSSLPFKIVITKEAGVLTAQATGQPAFALEAVAKDEFKFDRAGVEITFDSKNKEFTLKQGGGTYLFKK